MGSHGWGSSGFGVSRRICRPRRVGCGEHVGVRGDSPWVGVRTRQPGMGGVYIGWWCTWVLYILGGVHIGCMQLGAHTECRTTWKHACTYPNTPNTTQNTPTPISPPCLFPHPVLLSGGDTCSPARPQQANPVSNALYPKPGFLHRPG